MANFAVVFKLRKQEFKEEGGGLVAMGGLDNFVGSKIGQTQFARRVKYRDVFHQPRHKHYELESRIIIKRDSCLVCGSCASLRFIWN